MDRACQNCRFWAEGKGSSHGNRVHDGQQIWRYQCRRFPEYTQHWFDDWCGEFQPKDQSHD